MCDEDDEELFVEFRRLMAVVRLHNTRIKQLTASGTFGVSFDKLVQSRSFELEAGLDTEIPEAFFAGLDTSLDAEGRPKAEARELAGGPKLGVFWKRGGGVEAKIAVQQSEETAHEELGRVCECWKELVAGMLHVEYCIVLCFFGMGYFCCLYVHVLCVVCRLEVAASSRGD